MTAGHWIAFFLGFLACYPATELLTALAFRIERQPWYLTAYSGRMSLSTDPRGRPRGTPGAGDDWPALHVVDDET